jgi:hypothetical protein
MKKSERREQILREAWIGDAVLCLYARRRILREDRQVDAAKCARMTSNRFLSAVAAPSEAEAEIGRIFEKAGLETAFHWIDERLMPVFERQEQNRQKRRRE